MKNLQTIFKLDFSNASHFSLPAVREVHTALVLQMQLDGEMPRGHMPILPAYSILQLRCKPSEFHSPKF